PGHIHGDEEDDGAYPYRFIALTVPHLPGQVDQEDTHAGSQDEEKPDQQRGRSAHPSVAIARDLEQVGVKHDQPFPIRLRVLVTSCRSGGRPGTPADRRAPPAALPSPAASP